MWVRIGMHWGCPRARGDDIIGRDVNLAARISSSRGPARCCARKRPRNEAGEVPGVEFEPLGPVFVRGIADAVPLVRVFSATRSGEPGRRFQPAWCATASAPATARFGIEVAAADAAGPDGGGRLQSASSSS